MFLKKIKPFLLGIATVSVLCFSACEIDEVANPNAPTAESLLDGASLEDLRLLATGLEAVMRVDIEFSYWTQSIIGRDYYDLRRVDPRYTGELLGAGDGPGALDNNGFLTTRQFQRAYRIVRNANNLITATANARAGLTVEQERGIVGYAKTIKAFGLLTEAVRQFENGIRINVEDPDNLGPFTGSYQESLEAILALLDEAEGDLAAATEFVFELSSGFDGFNTPGTFLTFNRALYARVALYAGRPKAEILTELNKSFMDLDGDLENGAYHVFSTAGNDRRNPLFNTPNATLFVVHPDFLEDADTGDVRVAEKTTPFMATPTLAVPVTADGLSGDTQVSIYDSPSTPISIIRNEELILIYAEANIGVNNVEAANAINIIRNAAGLPDYPGPGDDASLLAEVLKQRRYSLFGEGHRWIDLRRFGLLNDPEEAPIDRPGDEVFDRFPRPVREV